MNYRGKLFFKLILSCLNQKKWRKFWDGNKILGKGNKGIVFFVCFLNIFWWFLMSCIIAFWFWSWMEFCYKLVRWKEF